MDAAVPDYIFASGLRAQQARTKRSPPASPRMPVPAATTSELEIKAVVGYLNGAHRAWPKQMQFDMPRLVQL
ncbi:hypothetical protein H4S01_000184 [Coemansia sp. RSA 2610]|nr:hypothetical protein H4S01_000184 [Coemansia sp. RSA 2610]